MKSRFTLAVLLLASIPAFSQNFTLELTGGAIQFGAAPMNIAVVPNGSGTTGHYPLVPPAAPSCANPAPIHLTGAAPFVMRGTTTQFGHLWEVELLFPPPGANEGNVSKPSVTWVLTGKYRMTITDTVTHATCVKVVGASGEYQFVGPSLAGWPKACVNPTNVPGQSPGLTGTLALRGHANIFPKFTPGGSCTPALASQANSRIIPKGFDNVHLDYKLIY